MNFEEFRERLMEDLKDSLQDRTGKEYTADANHVKKLQNADYDGIVIRPEGEQVGVNLDAQMLFAAYESGKSYDEVVEQATTCLSLVWASSLICVTAHDFSPTWREVKSLLSP